MKGARKVISPGIKSVYYRHVFSHLKCNKLAWDGAKLMLDVMKSQKKVLQSILGLIKLGIFCRKYFIEH